MINLHSWLLFFLVAIVARFFSFFTPVIDHDESTYLVVGQALFEGKRLYIDIFDIKPIGIYALFGLLTKIFGNSIFFIRLVGTLFIAGTAFFLYKISIFVNNNTVYALLSGFLYILITSLYDFGLACNTEIFYLFFYIAGLYLFLKSTKKSYLFIAGFLIGLSFIINYLVLLHTLMIIVFLFTTDNDQEISLKKKLSAVFCMLLGFITPFLIQVVYFFVENSLDEFIYMAFYFPREYQGFKGTEILLMFVFWFYFGYCSPILIPFFIAIRFSWRKKSPLKLLSYLWYFVALLSSFATGRFYAHYLIPTFPSMCLFIPSIFDSWDSLQHRMRINVHMIIVWSLIAASCVAVKNSFFYFFPDDTVRQVEIYLQERLKKDDILYTGNYEQVLYYLLNRQPPSKFVQKNHLLNQAGIIGVNVDKELQKIFMMQPRFILVKDSFPNDYFHEELRRHYILEKEFPENTKVYAIKP